MRDLLVFIVLAAIVFFAVGETIGWQVGIAGQTPVYVYKKDGTATAERRTIRSAGMPVEVTGQVRDGEVTVRVIYQDVGSFQTNRGADPERVLYEDTFPEGRTVALRETFDRGAGRYRVELHFRGATGLFHVPMPNSAEL